MGAAAAASSPSPRTSPAVPGISSSVPEVNQEDDEHGERRRGAGCGNEQLRGSAHAETSGGAAMHMQ